MQFYQKALKLAKICPDNSHQCDFLINIAWLEWMSGEYCTAQVHASEAQRLSQHSANLYVEARALWIGAMCLTSLGDFKQSADKLHRSRMMFATCGLADGNLDHDIATTQGEIHLQKSEYAEARNICNHMVETISPEKYPLFHTLSLVNMAHIDTLCWETVDAYCKLNKAKDIYKHQIYQTGIIYSVLDTGF
jgi:tetratricopeptide (TPR) repeat protein